MSSNSTSKPTEHITEAVAEPGPDWPIAKKTWGFAWELHWIGFGILFGLLAVHCFVALVQVNRRKGFGRKPLFVAINILLLVLGATRALYLLLDPYESRQNGIEDPKWMTLLLFGIAYPCLTSAFCLLHLAFLEVTKLRLGPGRIQNVRFLASIIGIHFVIVFTAESSASIDPELDVLLIVCQSFFILWGLLLSGSFIYSGLKVINRVQTVQTQLQTIEKQDEVSRRKTERKSSTTKVAKITIATSFLGFAVCGLHFYSMVGVYGLYSKVVHPAPWPWWAFQSLFRLVEVAMAATIAYSVMQPSEGAPKKASFTNSDFVVKKTAEGTQEKEGSIA